MKHYTLDDISNVYLSSFHELIRLSHERDGQRKWNPESFLIINYNEIGEFEYQSSNQSKRVPKGSILITYPHEPHKIILPKDNQQRTLIYSQTYVNEFMASLTRTHEFLLDHPEHPFRETLTFHQTIFTGIFDTVEYIKRMLSRDPISQQKMIQEMLLYDILLSILRHDYLVNPPTPLASERPSVRQETEHRIQKAIQYLNEHYAEDVAIETLASICTMSKFHFSRLFKQVTGRSPYQMLVEKRVGHAKFLLKNSALSVTEIAIEVGFRSPGAFYNIFNKEVGISPTVYRSH